jgi:PiT family inorganic phosphate transporter
MPLAFFVSSGAFLGWSLGANHASNAFGIAVVTRVIKYRTAVIICAVFAVIGAIVDGYAGIGNLGNFSFNNGVRSALGAFLVLFSAGLTITLMTVLSFPVSASQCVIGSILGWGLAYGMADFSGTTKFVSAWVLTPIGAMIVGFLLCKTVELFLSRRAPSVWVFDYIVRAGYYIAGMFSSYALGANSVANATGIYTGGIGLLDPFMAALVGGIGIAAGALTYSKKVMFTIGEGITALSPLTGVLVVLSSALAVYFYAIVGIPVSTSQAVVGAVVGAGLARGVNTLNIKMVRNILIAWFCTPTMAGLLSFCMALACVAAG